MQYRNMIGLVIGCLALLMPVASAKPLYIEITGGQNTGIPIAVVPFQGHVPRDSKFSIDKVIRRNLTNCGQFSALDLGDSSSYPQDVSEVDFGYWNSKGVQALIVGHLEKTDRDTFDVYFQLVDIAKRHAKPEINLKFSAKHLSEFRALGHHISDKIFEQLTGVRGFFSTRIAYITTDPGNVGVQYTLTVADADGYNDKPLVTTNYPLMSPAWSPQGDKIAYVSFEGNRAGISVVNVKSGQIKQVSRTPGINSAPSWSPDGKSLALVLSKDGAPKIYIKNLSNGRLKRVTHGGAIDTEPCWDPGGKAILFTSDRGGRPQIYRVTLATGKVKRLTFKGRYNTTPSLTPDGKYLIMLHQDNGGAYNIATQNLSTGRVKKLTRARLDESPSLAPNGMMVLYGTQEAKRTVLGAVTLDGRFRMRLPVSEGNVKEPAWSPFLY